MIHIKSLQVKLEGRFDVHQSFGVSLSCRTNISSVKPVEAFLPLSGTSCVILCVCVFVCGIPREAQLDGRCNWKSYFCLTFNILMCVITQMSYGWWDVQVCVSCLMSPKRWKQQNLWIYILIFICIPGNSQEQWESCIYFCHNLSWKHRTIVVPPIK